MEKVKKKWREMFEFVRSQEKSNVMQMLKGKKVTTYSTWIEVRKGEIGIHTEYYSIIAKPIPKSCLYWLKKMTDSYGQHIYIIPCSSYGEALEIKENLSKEEPCLS